MSCPHLLNWTVSYCRADDKPYIPSIYELQEYCTIGAHERCPLYIGDDQGHESLLGQESGKSGHLSADGIAFAPKTSY